MNLRPLLPGHVLVSPRRVVPRLCDLSHDEVTDLFLTVQNISRVVERVYGATGLNVAIQDGVDAGQSVPHVHTHIVPRKAADLEQRGGQDAIYDMLEGEEGDVGAHLKERDQGRPKFPKVDDTKRQNRSEEEMAQEAEWLARECNESSHL